MFRKNLLGQLDRLLQEIQLVQLDRSLQTYLRFLTCLLFQKNLKNLLGQ